MMEQRKGRYQVMIMCMGNKVDLLNIFNIFVGYILDIAKFYINTRIQQPRNTATNNNDNFISEYQRLI